MKIQNLQINDDDENKANITEQESEEETEVDDNGQTVVRKKQPSGPWKVIQDQKKEEVKGDLDLVRLQFFVSKLSTHASNFSEKVEEKPAPPPPEPVKPSAYVPPGRRHEAFDRNQSSSARK